MSFLSSLFGAGAGAAHLPPGPRGLPIIGNLRDIPSTEQWIYFKEEADRQGCPLTTYRVLGQTIIVLNSRDAIDALFTRQQDAYASKPPRRMAALADLTMTLPFMDPGAVFASARKQFHVGIGQAAVGAYDTDYEAASRRFLGSLAADLRVRDLTATIDDSLGHIFLKVSTGYTGAQTASVLTQMNDLAHFAADVLGDKYQIFDMLPFLASLPKFTPFVGPQLRLGAQWKTHLHALAESTVQLTKETQAAGTASVMAGVYTAQGAAADGGDEQSKMIAVTMNAGGMLASESALLTFLLAMAQHPDVQKRAQAEVDAVCGDRLPTMADRPRLPYVDAVLAEVLRWVSIAPVIAREVIADDHYADFLIPKGATIMANNYAISRDPSLFPSPETFDPARFLDPSGKALRPDTDTGVLRPMAFAFGFGRRTCPGRFLADALLFSHVAHVLRVFDVALPPAGSRERAADANMRVKSNGAACRIDEVYVQLALRSGAAGALIGQNAPAAQTQTNGHANANGSAAH